MFFNNEADNKNLINRLHKVVFDDRISHAYILEGPKCVDKRNFAESFIKGVLCPNNRGENCNLCSICDKIDHNNHEDIIYISSEGTSIKDADIIKMQDRLKVKPFGERNIVIIEDADTMTVRAQNRLLKTLEEPPGNSVIILLSENMENLVQTILSRCVKYRINYFGSDSYDFMMDKARKVAEMTLDRSPFYKVKKAAEEIAKDDNDAAAFMDCLQVVYRDILLENQKKISLYKNEDIIRNIHAVETARKNIKQGVSPVYAMKKLFLIIGG